MPQSCPFSLAGARHPLSAWMEVWAQGAGEIQGKRLGIAMGNGLVSTSYKGRVLGTNLNGPGPRSQVGRGPLWHQPCREWLLGVQRPWPAHQRTMAGLAMRTVHTPLWRPGVPKSSANTTVIEPWEAGPCPSPLRCSHTFPLAGPNSVHLSLFPSAWGVSSCIHRIPDASP